MKKEFKNLGMIILLITVGIIVIDLNVYGVVANILFDTIGVLSFFVAYNILYDIKK